MPNANFVVLFQKLISADKGKFIFLFQTIKLCPFLAKKHYWNERSQKAQAQEGTIHKYI